MLEWIWLHMAINAGVVSIAAKYADMDNPTEAAENLMSSSKLLAEAVCAIRETSKIIKARGVNLKHYRNDKSVDVTPYSYYIIKNSNFLTELYAIPELIDYKNAYPKLAEFEKKSMEKYMEDGEEVKIYKWKDVSDLKERRQNNIQILVNRNKYLFNDDKASFAWLRSNDTWFLESLVKTFGYVEDKALLDFVLKENYKDLAELEKILISRSCGGKNRLNIEVFAVVKNWKKKERLYDLMAKFDLLLQTILNTLTIAEAMKKLRENNKLQKRPPLS